MYEDQDVYGVEDSDCEPDDSDYYYDDIDPCDMDGDFDSGMASAGFGTDEDYGMYEHDFDDF